MTTALKTGRHKTALPALAALLLASSTLLVVSQIRTADGGPATNDAAAVAEPVPAPAAASQIRQRWYLGTLIVTLLGIRVYYRSRKK